MSSRSAEILCRNASEMGDAIMEGLIDVMHSASCHLRAFRGEMQVVMDF